MSSVACRASILSAAGGKRASGSEVVAMTIVPEDLELLDLSGMPHPAIPITTRNKNPARVRMLSRCLSKGRKDDKVDMETSVPSGRSSPTALNGENCTRLL